MYLKSGCVKLKDLKIMCRLAVIEGELRKPEEVGGRCGFFSSGSKQRRK